MKKRRLSRLMSVGLGFPETVFSSAPDIHIEGTNAVSVEGCRGILVYERGRVVLRLKNRTVCVSGKDLTMRSFFGSHILISGSITSVCFEEDGL